MGVDPNRFAGSVGRGLHDAMLHYNHAIGVKMVGEMLPDEANRVTLADDLDQYGLRVARITYKWGENDQGADRARARSDALSIEAIGASDIFRQEDDTNHLGGTARMGDPPGDERRGRRLSQLGTSPICGFATVPCFLPSAASTRL